MTQAEYSRRRAAASGLLAEHRLDGLLVSSAANVRYLTGFAGSNALLLVLEGPAVLFTDSRYRLQAAGETRCSVRIARGSLFAAVAKWLPRSGIRRLGFDPKGLTHAAFLSLKGGALRLKPASGLVEGLRMVKSPAEIELIRRAVNIGSQAFDRCLRLARPGMSELDLAAELDHRMRRLGAERPAFETIVASGRRAALPHASPTAKALASNELLLVDMGAVHEGYSGDMTRTVFVGRPGSRVKRLYASVLESQQAALAAVREGVAAGSVDRAARRVLKAHRLDRAFVHACGHGLGLEIHEPPRLGRGERTRLKAGMAITIEPGVYLQEFGGIRIEDTVIVTRNGCEILTPTSKELLTV